MDNGLVPIKVNLRVQNVRSLNPFCNGQWSRTATRVSGQWVVTCLNPFCNGQWSRTHQS